MAYLKPQLPDHPKSPAWLLASDDVEADINRALAHKSHAERWKYTKAQPILDLLNLPAQTPHWNNLPQGINASTLNHNTTTEIQPELSGLLSASALSQAPEAAAHLCFAPQVQVLEVTGDTPAPLILEQGALKQPLVIRVAEHASLDLREVTNEAAATHLQCIWIELAANSRVIHSRNSFNTGTQWQFLRVNIGRDATYTLHNHATGAELHRQDMQIVCSAPGAHAEVTSAALIDTGLHYDQQITVEHTAPNTTSQQTFHNIAQAKAKVTFNGRIHIHEHCNNVDATLSNKNLSLGDNAVINTKPELEIYTDDVKCAHGATVGRLDDSHLFYCESRGIPPQQARVLLSQAFLNTCTRGPLAEEAHSTLQELAGG